MFWFQFFLSGYEMVAPNGLGPPNPTKMLAPWVDLMGQPLSRNQVFEIFGGESMNLVKIH